VKLPNNQATPDREPNGANPFQLSDGSPIAFTVARPYDYVYQAPIPEIFEKAVGIQEHRIAGPGHYIGLRTDSVLMVNEGEIGFLIDANGRIVGHFMGNDLTDSHRESENMLYLPEAKGFDRCVALGPWAKLLDEPIGLADPRKPLPSDTRLTLVTYDHRDGSEYERGTYTLGEMQREPQELAWWATHNHTYPAGVMLLCGTGHAKGQRLQEHHVVHIHREGLGTLVNPTKRLEDRRPRPASVGKRTFTL
jgi:2-dehydro-3-deoxy-D-arabinonate dehydratase